jgi:DeoR/GlpR family transcriptional regulator of sugar metabolism
MKAAMRQLKIQQMLKSQEFVDLETFCRTLEASESSIRRDLISLEAQGSLKRVCGGAMSLQNPAGHLLDFNWQSSCMGEEKKRIARLTAGLIQDSQTVILDGGSTVVAVARELINRPLHIITNSLPIADIFADARRIELTLTGGYLYPRLRAMVGPLCEQMLSGVTADVLIMGIGGITEAGFSNNNTLVVGPQGKMIEVSRKIIVVADCSKFGHGAMIPLAPLNMADIVVSDTALALKYREMLEAHQVEVLMA